ncbi:hypothetical protein TNCV_4815871 [Trichonephila clavipes]|nr:hypothetical protein TNCV_4815871 [Trichonephila clavipes]
MTIDPGGMVDAKEFPSLTLRTSDESPKQYVVIHFLSRHPLDREGFVLVTCKQRYDDTITPSSPAVYLNVARGVPGQIMSRKKQKSAFDQVSEFDRGRIVAYRDCGLSFRGIDSRVGRNQTTVMWDM